MSLRAFHLVFIVASAILAVFVAAWSAEQYQSEHQTVHAVAAVLGLAGAGGLVVYGVRFQRKTRGL
jgi:predicted membrane protein